MLSTCFVFLNDLLGGLFECDHVAVLVQVSQHSVHLSRRKASIASASNTAACC